jgi:hypothetical protein
MRTKSNIKISYYYSARKLCMLTLDTCWKYGAGCEQCAKEIYSKKQPAYTPTTKETNEQTKLKIPIWKKLFQYLFKT